MADPASVAEGASWLAAFAAVADAQPDAPAIRVGELALGYGALLVRIERTRAALEAAGLDAGESVALLLPSGPALVEAFYAVASLGGVAVPLGPELTGYELGKRLDLARPALAIATPGEAARLVGADAPESLRTLLVWAREPGADDGAGAAGDAAWVVLAADGPRSPLSDPPAGPVSCHFTYKGLGEPLGALHASEDYTVAGRALLGVYPVGPGDVVLSALPLHPVYGLTSSVIAPLAAGAELRIPTGGPRRLLSALGESRARAACVVPPLLRVLIASARRGAPALHPELRLISGGSLLEPALAEEAAEALGAVPLQGYGATECLPVTVTRSDDVRPGSLGRPIAPEVRLAVRDAFGRDVAPGQAGEVFVSGPTVMSGYLRRPRETARFLRDGWFRTGDLGRFDAAGHLQFVGRREPFTKAFAQMVDLVEVERVIAEHPAVTDARAYPRRSTKGDDEVCVAVTLRGRAAVRIAELLAIARERLSPHKVPKRIKVYRASLAEDEPDF